MRGRGEGSVRQRRRKDGSAYWEARVRFAGQRACFYDDTKSGALAKARQARSDSERGVARVTATATVESYILGWLDRVRPTLRARTHASYSELARVHVFPTIGRVPLASLSPSHVRACLARVVASGRSEATAKRVRAVLSAALRDAQVDVGLPRNVARLATPPKSDRPAFAAEVVTPDQARAILAAFEGHRHWPMVAFSMATGVRQGELLALRWSDVSGGTVTITHAVDVQNGKRVLARPKTVSAQRTIALAELAVRALELRRVHEAEDRSVAARYVDNGLVFAGPAGGIRDRGAVRRVFQERLAAAGLPRIRWHALRRVFAALLQDQGVPLERIRDLLGHSELRVTEGYAYTMPGRLAEDVRAIDLALNGRVAGAWGAGEGGEQPENPAPPPGFEPGTS